MFFNGNRIDNEMRRWTESVLLGRSTEFSPATTDDSESTTMTYPWNLSFARTTSDDSLSNSSGSSSIGCSLSYDNTIHEELTFYDNLLPWPKDSPPSFSYIAETDFSYSVLADTREVPDTEVYQLDVEEKQEEYVSLGTNEEDRRAEQLQRWNREGQNVDMRPPPSVWYPPPYTYGYFPYPGVYHPAFSSWHSTPMVPPLHGSEEERAHQYIEFRLRELMMPSESSRIHRVPPSPYPNIREPTNADVIMGRGCGINAIAGNQNFRRLIQSQQPNYRLISRKEKPVFARCLVEFIRWHLGGRFLKYDPVTRLYSEVGDEKAELKTGQALREQSSARRRRTSSAVAVAASSMEDRDETGEESSP